ncbi:MAG TPA: 2-C-methyl-D-erythritol 4-phosphate cytidylyltransferase [Ignavibacteria bacterium]|jgi:2-C-methyl-D-erythritol 4-phosphate cytidylyltransferase
MKKNVKAILTAGGTGSRFKTLSGSNKPKQFLNLNNNPVILYSLSALQNSIYINEIVVASDKKYFELLHNLALKNKITKLTKLVEAGSTRFRSVRNAFIEIESGLNDFILIHDAARPNIDSNFINYLILKAFKKKEIVPALSVNETVKRARDRVVTETVKRENLWLVQTPQIFRYKTLRKAYQRAKQKNNFTDEASLIEMAGFKVNLVEGEKYNIKITTPEDMRLLKMIMH